MEWAGAWTSDVPHDSNIDGLIDWAIYINIRQVIQRSGNFITWIFLLTTKLQELKALLIVTYSNKTYKVYLNCRGVGYYKLRWTHVQY